VGAKVTEYQRGESKGEPKFEIFLYAKDDNGATYTPILDGTKATAGEYVKLLTTDLTFNMASMFTSNQTEHRKLIEKLFKPELDRLGADEVMAKILKAKAHRDGCRVLCQGSGAYLERFESENYTETMLSLLTKPDMKSIDDKIFNKKIERDRLTNGSEDSYKLAEEKAKSKRAEELQVIKDRGVALREKIRVDNEAKKAIYDVAATAYDKEQGEKATIEIRFSDAEAKVAEAVTNKTLPLIKRLLDEDKEVQLSSYKLVKPEMVAPDMELAKQLEESYAEYIALEKLPLPEIKKEEVDTTIIDEEIKKTRKREGRCRENLSAIQPLSVMEKLDRGQGSLRKRT